MASNIHPTAIIEKGAEIGDNVTIGAYAYVGSKVRMGNGCEIHHHATVDGNTELGENNRVFPYAAIGGQTQDLKYKGGNPGVRIGSNNCFREYMSVHAATSDGDFTVIGSHNNFLAYTHIAHDCNVGSHVIFSNCATLAGHVTVYDYVIIGGLTAAHQFTRIGEHCMIGGMTRIPQDVPPFMMMEGHTPPKIFGINKIGLERRGFSPERVEVIKNLYRIFYRDGLNRTQAKERVAQEMDINDPDVARFLEFVNSSQRGLV